MFTRAAFALMLLVPCAHADQILHYDEQSFTVIGASGYEGSQGLNDAVKALLAAVTKGSEITEIVNVGTYHPFFRVPNWRESLINVGGTLATCPLDNSNHAYQAAKNLLKNWRDVDLAKLRAVRQELKSKDAVQARENEKCAVNWKVNLTAGASSECDVVARPVTAAANTTYQITLSKESCPVVAKYMKNATSASILIERVDKNTFHLSDITAN